MKKLKHLILIFIFISCSESNNENVNSLESKDKLESTNHKEIIPERYYGVYHFGESEAESELIVNGYDGKYFAQIKYGEFNNEATDYIWTYENLKNVRIENDKFYSDKTNGEFVQNENGKIRLKVYNAWSLNIPDGNLEISGFSNLINDFYSGTFSFTSFKKLTNEDLLGKGTAELKSMRNEIFARYGYKFNSGGKMKKYFSSKKWYKPQHEDVNSFLTILEKENIKKIKKKEENSEYKTEELKMEDFPISWVEINENENGEFIIIEPCQVSKKGFDISQYPDGKVYFNVYEPFDVALYDLVDFEMKGNPVFQEYQGILKWKHSATEKESIVKIYWDKLSNYAMFENLYSTPVRLIDEVYKKDYKAVKEECDEDDFEGSI